jgi:hypothetical protein
VARGSRLRAGCAEARSTFVGEPATRIPHVWKCQEHAGGAESLPGVQEQAVVTACSGIQECKPTGVELRQRPTLNTDASSRYCLCNRSSVVGLYQ